MYDIRDYQKKRDLANIGYIVDMIIDSIKSNLKYNVIYKNNFIITGFNEQISNIIELLKAEAEIEDIDIDVSVKFIPTSSSNIVVSTSKKNNMFLKFMMLEKEFYNKICNDGNILLDMKEIKISNLYVLHALQTALYHAGYDNINIKIKENVFELNAANKVKTYVPKVALFDMVKYNNLIEQDRKDNLSNKIKKKKND